MLITTNYLTPKAKFMVQEDGGGRREHRFMIFDMRFSPHTAPRQQH